MNGVNWHRNSLDPHVVPKSDLEPSIYRFCSSLKRGPSATECGSQPARCNLYLDSARCRVNGPNPDRKATPHALRVGWPRGHQTQKSTV